MNVDYEKRELAGSAAQLVAAADSRAVCAHCFLGLFLYRYRAKNKKWLKYGLIYFIILAIAFVLPLWVISIIHGLKVRAAYLIQLDVFKQNVEARAYEAVRHEAEAKFGGKPAHPLI